MLETENQFAVGIVREEIHGRNIFFGATGSRSANSLSERCIMERELVEEVHCEGGMLEDSEYNEREFRRCVFSNATLRNVRFSNCAFEDCVLRNVSFRECSMLNGEFRRCALLGLDWSVVRRHGARLPLLAGMTACTVKYNTFIDIGMARMDFTSSTLHDCYFQDCDLRRALFRGCDLRKTVFQNCNLSRADFRDARDYGINVMNNTVTKALFSQPDVIGLLSGFDIVVE